MRIEKNNEEEVNFREGLQAASSRILEREELIFFLKLILKATQVPINHSIQCHSSPAFCRDTHTFSEKAFAKTYLYKTPFHPYKTRHQNIKPKEKTLFSKRILKWILFLRGTDILKKYLLIFYVNYCTTETVTLSRSGCSLCKW